MDNSTNLTKFVRYAENTTNNTWEEESEVQLSEGVIEEMYIGPRCNSDYSGLKINKYLVLKLKLNLFQFFITCYNWLVCTY